MIGVAAVCAHGEKYCVTACAADVGRFGGDFLGVCVAARGGWGNL